MTAPDLLALTVAVPIMGACAVLVGRNLPRAVVDMGATLVAAGVVAVDGALLAHHGRAVLWAGGWTPVHGMTVGISFVADPLNAGLALTVAALVTLGLLYSWRYFESAEAHYHALMLLFLAGMQGFSLSGDLFDMFVFFELMGAVAYALTGFKVEDPTAVQGGLNFGVMNSLGAYFALAGIALLYGSTGQLGLPQIHRALAGHHPTALVVAAFVLVSSGFLVKAAMAPFHFWLADAHAVAPSSVCVLFSGVMVELGVYGFARVYWEVFHPVMPAGDVRRAFVVMGALTAVVGALMCFVQRHLKRLLAYSTIAHVGLFLMGVATLDTSGTTGVAAYVAGHAGAKSALFLLAGVALNRYGSVDERSLHGRGRAHPVVGWLFVLGALALSGLPPFGVGLGHALTEDALAKAGYPWAPVLFVIVSAVTGGAVLRAGLRIWFGVGPRPSSGRAPGETEGKEEPDVEQPLRRLPVTMSAPVVVLLGGCLFVGADPAVVSAMGHAAARFVDPAGYAAAALGGPVPAPAPVHTDWWTTSGVALSLTSAAAAVALAFAALYSRVFSGVPARLAAPLLAPVAAVRRAHSGHIGDYAAWFMAGLAALAALVGVPLR